MWILGNRLCIHSLAASNNLLRLKPYGVKVAHNTLTVTVPVQIQLRLFVGSLVYALFQMVDYTGYRFSTIQLLFEDVKQKNGV